MRAKILFALIGLALVFGVLALLLGFGRAKVAVINRIMVISETAEGRAATQRLEQQFRPRLQQLNAMGKETLNYRRLQEDSQVAFEREQNRVRNELYKKLSPLVAEYARRERYEAVLDVSDNPNSPVIWFKKTNDITKQMVAEYDKTYPIKMQSH